MVHFIHGDLFSTDCDVICYQTNCKGSMLSGVAKQVRELYPNVYESYTNLVDLYSRNKYKLLGKTQFVKFNNKTFVNMFSQYNYGYDNKKYTDYEAFYRCLVEVHDKTKDKTIAFPYKIGCDKGGGDWNIILCMIETVLKDREVYIYRLEE